MSTITISATYQGFVSNTVVSASVNWVTDVRNASVGVQAITVTTNQSYNNIIRAYLVSGRGGIVGFCSRTFLYFDLSSVTSGGTITSTTLKVLGTGSNSAGVIPVEGTPMWSSGTLSTSDYNNLDHSTPYASAISSFTWNTGGYNNFTLNSTAISDMNTNSELNVCLIENDYDYGNTNPALGVDVSSGIEFLDPTNPIELEITYTPFYGNTINGIIPGNIGEVNGIIRTNIGKVNGI